MHPQPQTSMASRGERHPAQVLCYPLCRRSPASASGMIPLAASLLVTPLGSLCSPHVDVLQASASHFPVHAPSLCPTVALHADVTITYIRSHDLTTPVVLSIHRHLIPGLGCPTGSCHLPGPKGKELLLPWWDTVAPTRVSSPTWSPVFSLPGGLAAPHCPARPHCDPNGLFPGL